MANCSTSRSATPPRRASAPAGPTHSYVGFVAAALREHAEVRVVNLAVSGSTVRMAIDDPAARTREARARHPDRLHRGERHRHASIRHGSSASTAQLLAALPDHAIIADLPTFYFLPAERKVRTANAIMRRLAAERGLTVVPLHARTRRYGLWGVSTQFAGDLFHPNDRGYRVWASAFIPEVLRRLRTRA